MPFEKDFRFSHEEVREYADGACIFAEGEEGRDLYIIQEGAAVIRKRTPIGELELAEFGKGDFFGDMALLQGIPRFAGAYAKGVARILILKPGGFLLKIRRDPTFAFEMLQQLSLRVKISNERLFEAVKAGKIPTETVQKILHQMESSTAKALGDPPS